MAKTKDGAIYIAKESFTCLLDGEQVAVVAGQTRVREGHPLLRGREQMFEPMRVHYDIEQATQAPGEKRGE